MVCHRCEGRVASERHDGAALRGRLAACRPARLCYPVKSAAIERAPRVGIWTGEAPAGRGAAQPQRESPAGRLAAACNGEGADGDSRAVGAGGAARAF
jgi:hypothetical protein